MVFTQNTKSLLVIRRNVTGKEKPVELTRVDYIIMKYLKKKGCTCHFEGMTLKEIMCAIKISRPTLYRKMTDLQKHGYVGKGCKSTNADTFYLSAKGIQIVESGGLNND